MNATGLVTGVSPGTGRVQAREGSLGSNVVTLTVIARADTLLLLGDSIRTVPADPGTSGDLVTEYGGQVRLAELLPGQSTSATVAKIKG